MIEIVHFKYDYIPIDVTLFKGAIYSTTLRNWLQNSHSEITTGCPTSIFAKVNAYISKNKAGR